MMRIQIVMKNLFHLSNNLITNNRINQNYIMILEESKRFRNVY